MLRFCDESMVSLIVGESKNVIQVHEGFLLESSPVFKAAFKHNFKESSERAIKLPNDDVESVEQFVQYLYSGRLVFPKFEPETGGGLVQGVRLFRFSDKYQMVKLKNLICQTLSSIPRSSGLGHVPPSDVIQLAYANTALQSTLRKLLADWYASNAGSAWFTDETNQAWLRRNPEFAVDLAVALAQGGRFLTKNHPFEIHGPDFYAQKECPVDLERLPFRGAPATGKTSTQQNSVKEESAATKTQAPKKRRVAYRGPTVHDLYELSD